MAAAPPAERELELDPKYDNYDFPTKAAIPFPGHPGYLTEQQQAQVSQLRMMLESKGYTERLDTITLLRFLRARKFDVNLTLKMFEDCEQWRKEKNLDETVITWDYPEKPKVFEYYPQYYHKTDKDGRPIYIEALGKADLKALRNITTEERMLTNLSVEYERVADPRLPACSRKAGKLLETCCTIIDLKGVGLWRASEVYPYMKQASNMSQNYYPERLGKLYVINAPWGFSGVWSIVKGWLDPVTVDKIHILGSGYLPELLKQIPEENLPEQYGGKCKCAETCELSDMGPWHDPQWAKLSWWEKKAEERKGQQPADATIDNSADQADGKAAEPTTIPAATTGDTSDATASAKAPAAA